MSYDIYTFILSLFGVKQVWAAYLENKLPRLKALMHRLFQGGLYYIVMGKIAKEPEKMISLNHINNTLNGIFLQYDLSYIYTEVGLMPPPLYLPEANRIILTVSKDGHICTQECGIHPTLNPSYKTCETNTYSKTGLTGSKTLYNWDYC
jgi:hypothetical protein